MTLSIDASFNINKKHYNTKNTSDSKVKAWDSRKADEFIENFDVIKAAEIETQLDNLLHNGNISKHNVNEVIENIGNLFKSCSKETFGEARNKSSGTYDKVKPWFNSECFRTRNLYHKCRKMYNRYKTNYYNFFFFKFISKKYKTTLSKTHKTYKETKIKDIRNLKINDPRKYWKLINSQSKTDSNNLASLDDLYNFFKTSNTQASDSHDKDVNDPNLSNDETNGEINQIISENEILQAIKTLKNNKSPGVDDIVNEQIKTTVSYMLPIYVKLFNMIFDTGIIPENWTIGKIKPIYKNKGDPKQPENYRPITLVSCFGKLFTSVINNRLTKYAESHDLITSSQAGFRKHYSTVDNLFIIKSLIDIVRSNKKKLYCCCVDFKQAFDTVWREGLWTKLLLSKINGKCFNIIYNLYKDIKSKITTSEGVSNYFSCNVGVRQGENLLPFLFCIFLNDLETYLRQKNVTGITCNVNNEEIMIFLKIFLLLYADDTVIFSDNEINMQHALNVFENYCSEWKLTVNTAKTKIMIFGQGRKRSDLKFTLLNTEIEVVNEYKYLGILLGQSGSFLVNILQNKQVKQCFPCYEK